MSESVSIALLGMIGTLVGTLSGVLISSYIQNKNAEADRREKRRERQGASLARAIVALREWREAVSARNNYLAAASAKTDFMARLEALSQGVSGERQAETRFELLSAMTDVKLYVKDAVIANLLDDIDQECISLGEKSFMDLNESFNGQRDVVELLVRVNQRSERLKALVNQLETLSREHVASSLLTD